MKITNITFMFAAMFSLACSAQAQTPKNIFNCVDKVTLQANPACVSAAIENNQQLTQQIAAINKQASNFDEEQVLSLMTMNPKDLTIEIVALTDNKPSNKKLD